MSKNSLLLTIFITVAILFSVPGAIEKTFAFGGANHSSSPTPTTTSDRQFVPPKINIDGKELNPQLIITSLRFSSLQKSIFHGPVDFKQFAARNLGPLLEVLIGRELLVREANSSGMKLGEDEFSDHLATQVNSFGGNEKFGELLGSYGITLAEFKQVTRHTYIARKYVENVLLKSNPLTEKNFEDYYRDNIEKYTDFEERNVDFVMFSFVGGTPESAIKDLRSAASEVKSSQQLTSFMNRLRGSYRNIQAKPYKSIIYSPKRGASFWGDIKDLKENEAIYFARETKRGTEHYVYVVNRITPENTESYESVKESIVKKLTASWPQEITNEKVEALKETADVKIIR